MSVSVYIKTQKELSPDNIFDYLVSKSEQIIITSSEFPSIHIGTYQKAIRGVEINKEEDGYEVRVCTFSSVSDYKLFLSVVLAIVHLSDGELYFEEKLIENPKDIFNEQWIESERKASFQVTQSLIKYNGTPIVIYGLFAKICIGTFMFDGFDISLDEEYSKEKMDELQDYLCNTQWHLSNITDTSSRLKISSPKGDKTLSVSLITIKNNKVSEFDYISVADILAIMDLDNEDSEPALIPFKEVTKILPKGVLSLLDEWQYLRKGELTVEMVREMKQKAKVYQPQDLFYRPTFPGYGYDDKQNTYILMWNPSISSVTMSQHNYEVQKMLTSYFDWSIREYKDAKCGDRFFMVKVGEGKTGIVMSGVFSSNPYKDEDWSGRGRETYYVDLIPNIILNPEEAPMITTEQLTQAIPSFSWSGGSSGRLLSPEDSIKLEKLWSNYIEENIKNVDGKILNMVYKG